MGRSRICWNGTTSALQPEEITSKGTRVSCVYFCDGKLTKNPKTGLYFRTCEDGAGWHLIPYRISPRSEFFSQAYKNWHITLGINLGPD